MFAFVDTRIGSVIGVNKTASITVTATAIIRRLPIILINLTVIFEMVSVMSPILVSESPVQLVRVRTALSCKRAMIPHVVMSQSVAVSLALA